MKVTLASIAMLLNVLTSSVRQTEALPVPLSNEGQSGALFRRGVFGILPKARMTDHIYFSTVDKKYYQAKPLSSLAHAADKDLPVTGKAYLHDAKTWPWTMHVGGDGQISYLRPVRMGTWNKFDAKAHRELHHEVHQTIRPM